MLARDCLNNARRFMADVIAANALAVMGDEEGSRCLLAKLAERAEREVPVINGVVETLDRVSGQLNAADGPEPTKRVATDRFGRPCPARQPQPDLHATNDDHPLTSEQPASPVG